MSLTPAQWEQVRVLRGEYLAAGLCTDPADRPEAERAITAMYARAGKPVPRFVWCDSPATAVRAQWLLSSKIIRHSLGASLGDNLRHSLGDSLWASLEDSLRHSLRDSLGASLGASLEDSLRHSLRDSLWASLGASLGDSLEDSLRHSLGDSLWASLWASLWDSLRASLGASLWDSLWASLGWTRYFWGQHEWWVAYYDIPQRLGLVTYKPADAEALSWWAAIARSCGWWWPYDGVCIISGRPAAVHVESWDQARGTVRLHRAGGPAMEFRDGWKVWAWHGRQVPQWVAEKPTAEAIAKEENIEVRRCAIESLGWDKFAGQAGLIPAGRMPGSGKRSTELAAERVPDPGNPGQYLTLYDVPERLWGSRVRLLMCTNGTAERTGERRKYGLTVPATVSDPVEAAAWTYGLTREQYLTAQRRT